MSNRDTYEETGGPSVGFGGANDQDDSAAEQSGSPTPMDQSFEEERQRRQENWSPAGQTGFDNSDVERHDEMYPGGEASDPEQETRESVGE